MKSRTKNVQELSTLIKICQKAFPEKETAGVKELTEGYFNAAYQAVFTDGEAYILKIAPSCDMPVMSYEKNIMLSEIKAMELAAERTDIPVAKVKFYDDTCTVCTAPYFFMEKLKGRSLDSMADQLSREEKKRIQEQVGRMNWKINQITGEKFGYPGQPELQGRDWYEVFWCMIKAALEDAEKMSVNLNRSEADIWKRLEKDREIFGEVTVPQLVHWDLWDGNIFVEEGRITGLIDWERSLWGDPLMEVGFRTYGENSDFRKGYGREVLSPQETRRALWYDVYTMLLVAQECAYRQYETREIYEWSVEILTDKFAELCK